MRQNSSIYEIFQERCHYNSDKTFLIFEEKDYTYQEIWDMVNFEVQNLLEFGVRKGDKLGLLMENSPEFIVIYLAVARLGMVLVPINPKYSQEYIFNIFDSLNIKYAILDDHFYDNGYSQSLKTIVPDIIFLNRITKENTLTVQKRNRNLSYDEGVINDDFVILFTSGSTGNPKGVVHTQKDLILNSLGVIEFLSLTQKDIFLFSFPLTSMFGIGYTTTVILLLGSIVLMKLYEPDMALKLIEKYRATVHSGHISMFNMEMNQRNLSDYNLDSLRLGMVGGEMINGEFLLKVRDMLGLKLYQCYGMTEAAGAITLVKGNADMKEWISSAGKPLPGVKLKIVNINGNEISENEIGEIYCKAEYFAKKYYIDGKEIPLSIDGWFRTQDIGYILDGCLCISGRKAELITMKGKIVFISQIESRLSKLNFCASTAIIYQNDYLYIFISTIKNEIISEKLIFDVIKNMFDGKEMSTFVKIMIIQQFPLTYTGKIDRLKLANWIKD